MVGSSDLGANGLSAVGVAVAVDAAGSHRCIFKLDCIDCVFQLMV